MVPDHIIRHNDITYCNVIIGKLSEKTRHDYTCFYTIIFIQEIIGKIKYSI